MSNPKVGRPCRIWYAEKMRPLMPHHGMAGVILIAAKGKPRNHMVRVCPSCAGIASKELAIPAGNLQPVEVFGRDDRFYLIHARRCKGGWTASWCRASSYMYRLDDLKDLKGTYPWRSLLGVYRDKAHAIDWAKEAIRIDQEGSEPLLKLADYRDRRMKTPWQREAERLRKQKAGQA